MTTPMMTGSMVALVTPMLPDGNLDIACLKQLIDWHVQEGTAALIIAGTTGESATLTVDEQALLIRTSVEHANRRIKIIAGTGANSTHEAIALTQLAKNAGADAGLSVVPYYNKPSQEGLFQHFKLIAQSVDLPLILYNVPGRTVCDLSNETALRLAQVPGIVGIKDATGDIARGTALIRLAPAHFAVYSGDDATAPALMLLGGKGNISVTANVAPGLMSQLCRSAIAGDAALTRKINDQLIPLHKNLFLEANPIPVKWLLQHMGRLQSGLRLPLTPLSAAHHAALLEALRVAGIDVTPMQSAA